MRAWGLVKAGGSKHAVRQRSLPLSFRYAAAMEFPGMMKMVAFVPAEKPGSHNALVVAPTGPPGRTGDPVKDLEAKLKYIQDTVPNKVSNVSGRHGCDCEAFAHCAADHLRATARLARGQATFTSTAWCAGSCF